MMVTKLKKRVTLLLKRWPALYHSMSNIYSILSPLHLKELLLGTRVREREWAIRHTRKGNDWDSDSRRGEPDEWVMGYWDSREHSHRSLLMERLCSYTPVTSILEVGCNCGPNLYQIAKKFPDIEIEGIDINPRAVEKGNELLASQGVSNIKLSVGRADELERYQDKSFDIVFTDAVLIYIGPDKIKKVIEEMLRITRRALILVEWHSFAPRGKDPEGLGLHSLGYWKRDYAALLRQFVPEEQVDVTKIPEQVWPVEGWKEFGAIIEVMVQQER